MKFSDGMKHFKRAAARWGMFGSAWLVQRLPFRVVKVVMQCMIFIGFRLTIRLKSIAAETLDLAFGDEKSKEEKKMIIKQCFANFGRGLVEMMYYCFHPEKVRGVFAIEGKEHLDQALQQGKGVVAVTAHFGNFPLMQLAMAQYGYPVNVVIRRVRDEKIAEFAYQMMNKSAVKPIYATPRRACVQQIIQALRKNEIVFLLIDQNFGSDGGIFVDFFGRKSATATGPVVIADRTQAPIVPIFNISEPGDQHRIFIEPRFDLEPRPNQQEMLQVNVSRLTQVIERYIRRYPSEWGWMHRRWKSQPVEEGVRQRQESMNPIQQPS